MSRARPRLFLRFFSFRTTPAPAPAPAAAAQTAAAYEREKQTRYWTSHEHEQFLKGAQLFGAKNYVAIAKYVK
eukprot:CAMPEP_0184718988 /NCGR_PEP_ID=MMETSP0314-20130426/8023_1 /TAXON_ID=38298 /ORGANISM="Rhodella maculata, Strain CCMP 736" /LENGTH=72 /DNA_ID=CAMNT_0027182815 /DNA_START=117 /DNA_END=332 /DNA_ORIENTATION=+